MFGMRKNWTLGAEVLSESLLLLLLRLVLCCVDVCVVSLGISPWLRWCLWDLPRFGCSLALCVLLSLLVGLSSKLLWLQVFELVGCGGRSFWTSKMTKQCHSVDMWMICQLWHQDTIPWIMGWFRNSRWSGGNGIRQDFQWWMFTQEKLSAYWNHHLQSENKIWKYLEKMQWIIQFSCLLCKIGLFFILFTITLVAACLQDKSLSSNTSWRFMKINL